MERPVKDARLDRLRAKAEVFRIVAPDDMATEMGPLCTGRQRDRMAEVVAASLDAGARLVTGGLPEDGPGFFVRPTILDCTGAPDAPCLSTEIFGPVLSVQAFDSGDEALRLAIDSPDGFAAGVFTTSLSRAHRMVRRLRAGVVWVNTYRAVSPIAPFGGHGLSGRGREGGLAAALDYTTVKTVWLRTSDDPIPDPFVMR
ncbi:aldehyde dehydrogenase family protein [Rubellimicrobium aerolatum]|uniref:aldehyde dehydrogenase family protein n=1 Tax=Rubellimicrobium aerolatum TaxID=490979 RepID=UPI0031588602